MNATDYHLRAYDETEMLLALDDAGLLNEAGEPALVSGTHVLDWIGALAKPAVPSSDADPEDEAPAPEFEELPGFHVNYRALAGTALPEALEPLLIPTPKQPLRVWAS